MQTCTGNQGGMLPMNWEEDMIGFDRDLWEEVEGFEC